MKAEYLFSTEKRKKRFTIALRYCFFFSQATTCLIIAGCSKGYNDIVVVKETQQKGPDSGEKAVPKQEGNPEKTCNGEKLADRKVTRFTQDKEANSGGKAVLKEMSNTKRSADGNVSGYTKGKKADGGDTTAPKQGGNPEETCNGKKLTNRKVTRFTQDKEADGGGKAVLKEVSNTKRSADGNVSGHTKGKKEDGGDTTTPKQGGKSEEARSSKRGALRSMGTYRVYDRAHARTLLIEADDASQASREKINRNKVKAATADERRVLELDDCRNIDRKKLVAHANKVLEKVEKQQKEDLKKKRRNKRDSITS